MRDDFDQCHPKQPKIRMMNSQLRLYEQLELLPPGTLSAAPPAKMAKGLQRLASQLLHIFAPPDDEPKIRIRYSLNGEVWFDAHDRVTHQQIRNTTDDELRIWLEQRYRTRV